MAKKKPKSLDNTIVLNKKARHDYFLQDTFEAGVVLEGWEVKSLRLKKVQLIDSYVLIKDGGIPAWVQCHPIKHGQYPCHCRPKSDQETTTP